MRTEFEMTQEDMDKLLEASKPVVAIKIGSYMPRGPQENANDAWASLGNKLGFKYMTVKSVSGKSDLFFTAEAEPKN